MADSIQYCDNCETNQMCHAERKCMRPVESVVNSDEVIQRLRGQLQNCVNHLELCKRQTHGKSKKSVDDCIESANKALYETLGY